MPPTHTEPIHVYSRIRRNHHCRDTPTLSRGCEGIHSLTPVRTPSHVSVPHSPPWRRVTHLPSNSTRSQVFFFSRYGVECVVKWTFTTPQTDKEMHFRVSVFQKRYTRKDCRITTPKTSRTFPKVKKTFMTGGMWTTDNNTKLTWDNSVVLLT